MWKHVLETCAECVKSCGQNVFCIYELTSCVAKNKWKTGTRMSAAALARVFGPALQSKRYNWDKHTDALRGEASSSDSASDPDAGRKARKKQKKRRKYEERFIKMVKVMIYFASDLFPGLDSKVEWRLSTLINCQGQEVSLTYCVELSNHDTLDTSQRVGACWNLFVLVTFLTFSKFYKHLECFWKM